MTNQQIAVIVDWWGNLLNPIQYPDNGTPPDIMKTLMNKVDYGITTEDILNFKATLTQELKKLNQEQLTIYNDYDLDDLLYKVASSTGLPTSCPPFPIKTGMWITSKTISVRLGYSGKTELLWGDLDAIAHKIH